LVTVPVLLVLPLVAMLGLMSVGAATGAGVLWMVLVAAALVFLLVFLVRGTTRR
jgi:hypothetical protein